MNTERLFSVLSTISPLPDGFRASLEKEMTFLSLPKDYMLLEAPKVSDQAYFLDAGFAMSFRYRKAKKQTECFWKAGQIIVSAKSFFEQLPSVEYIQLMESSEVLCISYDGVQRMFQQYPEALFIYGVIMNKYYEHSRERAHDMQYLSAEERFEKLLKSFPGIEQIVPQEYISSYLGIQPQSLSRIKRRKGT